VLRENLIRLAGVDVSASATGPWDHDLMASSGPLRPHWYGSVSRTSGLAQLGRSFLVTPSAAGC
jgi:hypothetical protein